MKGGKKSQSGAQAKMAPQTTLADGWLYECAADGHVIALMKTTVSGFADMR